MSLALLVVACAEPPLEGVVVDALTGAPIEGASVVASGRRTTTDAAGRFRIEGASAPVHAIDADHLGLRRLEIHDPSNVLALWPRQPSEAAVDAHLARLEAARSLRDDPSDPALRPAARALLRGAPLVDEETSGDVGAARAALDAPPTVIRIWRRSIDGAADSCSGRIDEIPFDDYIAGVLPHEWIPSWDDESLRAGAIAIRTYAWRWVASGGKYDCADLDDTARSQVYRDDRNERASAAVMATAGMVVTIDGALASGEYSAENGNPTALGVDEPLCDGRTVNGHGRGMCQWGSQRWALDGRDHLWIATHYWPGSAVEGGAPAADDYDARAAGADAPTTLEAGARARVTVRFENVGRREWTAEGTRLATPDGSPCPLFDDVSWVDAATATGPDAYRYAAGETGEFSFWVTAPSVTEATEVSAALRLSHEGVGPFGDPVTLRVQVTPIPGSPPPPPMGSDAGMGESDAGTAPPGGGGAGLSGGCATSPSNGRALTWLALAVAIFVRRRRAG
ncbi:MAG: carboxypeptidase regulatory-like domain-containing protein [Myxococcales bacterium]|nr:carboxypeptidase regulatory-like domain-containing protein [Myxococcales bacterium]